MYPKPTEFWLRARGAGLRVEFTTSGILHVASGNPKKPQLSSILRELKKLTLGIILG